MTLLKRPTSELVVPRWINTIEEFSDRPGGICATRLPIDNSSWGASGFIVMPMVVGGGPNPEIPQKDVVVQLDFWAGTTGKGKPLWNVAGSLMEAVIAACYDESTMKRELTLSVRGVDYGKARMLEMYPIGHEIKDENDPAQWAHYSHDFMCHWVVIS